MIRLAVFDCDGTLVDSQANICRAMEAAFTGSSLQPPSRDAIRRIVGLSLVEAVAALLPEANPALHHRLAHDYKHAFQRLRAEAGLDEEPLFDGMRDVLDLLQARGWMLGVATGKSDRGLAHVLEHHGIAHLFSTLHTADRHPSKPDPSMLRAAIADTVADETVMIGDTAFDMAMARAARARAVGVAWGYHDVSDLVGAGAEVVATRVADLPELLA